MIWAFIIFSVALLFFTIWNAIRISGIISRTEHFGDEK